MVKKKEPSAPDQHRLGDVVTHGRRCTRMASGREIPCLDVRVTPLQFHTNVTRGLSQDRAGSEAAVSGLVSRTR
jgi:hypothetical protein